jgi:hypothetical protein
VGSEYGLAGRRLMRILRTLRSNLVRINFQPHSVMAGPGRSSDTLIEEDEQNQLSSVAGPPSNGEQKSRLLERLNIVFETASEREQISGA